MTLFGNRNLKKQNFTVVQRSHTCFNERRKTHEISKNRENLSPISYPIKIILKEDLLLKVRLPDKNSELGGGMKNDRNVNPTTLHYVIYNITQEQNIYQYHKDSGTKLYSFNVLSFGMWYYVMLGEDI